MTLESLARTIAKAQHGTDAYWANYMPAARAVYEKTADWLDNYDASEGFIIAREMRALIAQSDGAQ